MKHYTLLLLFALAGPLQAQKTFYGSVAVSATNSDNFQKTTQYSAEAGMLSNNVGYALSAGSRDLDYKKFWFMAKVSYTFDISEWLNPYVTTGVGGYFDNSRMFIEYGGGIISTWETISPYLQITNRDQTNYLTFGLRINF